MFIGLTLTFEKFNHVFRSLVLKASIPSEYHYFFISSENLQIFVEQLISGNVMFEPQEIRSEHKDVIHDVSYDYYGQRIATCSSDQTVKVYD